MRNVQRSMRLFSTFLMYISSHTSFLQEISINLFQIDVDPCTSLMTYTSLMYIDVHVLCTYLKGVHILRASHTSCVQEISMSLKRQRIRVLQVLHTGATAQRYGGSTPVGCYSTAVGCHPFHMYTCICKSVKRDLCKAKETYLNQQEKLIRTLE